MRLKPIALSAAILTGIVFAPPAYAKRSEVNVVMPCQPEQRRRLEEAGYSSAVISKGMLYVSGVASMQREGEADFQPAFTRIFEAIGRTLASTGASWDDVVDVTSYHTNIDTQLEQFGKVSARYLKAPFPTSTVIGVNRLIVPQAIAEVKVVAELPRGAKRVCF
jgi:enamine deaminase RidA (YjgF/YER057c/UK114 family)